MTNQNLSLEDLLATIGDPISDQESIVPAMFNQLNIFLIDISTKMLEKYQNGNPPYRDIYYAFSEYLESLFNFRQKKSYSLSVLCFAKEPYIALDLTNLQDKQGTIPMTFLPSSVESITLDSPVSLGESNLVPALNLASEFALEYNQAPPQPGLPTYISVVILSMGELIDAVEVKDIVDKIKSYKNFQVYFGYFGSISPENLSSLESLTTDELTIVPLTDLKSIVSFFKKTSTDNYKFRL